MEKLTYSLGAYKSTPRHVLVSVDRREIARVHHEDDLQYIVTACNAHGDLVAALKSIKAAAESQDGAYLTCEKIAEIANYALSIAGAA